MSARLLLRGCVILSLLCAVASSPRLQRLRSRSLLGVRQTPQDSANDAAHDSKAGQVAEDLKGIERPESATDVADTASDIAGLPSDVDTDDPQAVAKAHAHNYSSTLTLNIVEALITVVSGILFTALFACCYKSYKEDPPPLLPRSTEHNPELLDTKVWRYGLCDCFSGDKVMCLLACCCPALRWADTMRMAGIYSFWTGVFLFAVLSGLTQVTAGLTGLILLCVGMLKRQAIRNLFQLPNGTCMSYLEDCCIWCWCSCCAIIQEARQIEEAYAVQHRVVATVPQLTLRAK